MDRSELGALLRPESLRLLATLHQEQPSSDSAALVSGLRKAGHDPEVVRAVVGQWGMHLKAADKFRDFAKRMLFSKDCLEQSTRLAISSHHAHRFESVGITSVADLGCGIGGDSLAFAGTGLRVQAVEAADVTRVAPKYVDPARAVALVVGDYQAIAESLRPLGLGEPQLLPADA